jgi:hypothetical protein
VTGVFDFKTWYRQNAELLSAKRKLRYHTDPAYKERVLKINAVARRARKREQFQEQEVERKARVVGESPVARWKSRTIEVNGKKVQAFTIGALARALGRSIQAIRLYEGQGLIASTPYRSPKGDRLYTYDMVQEIQATLTAAGRTSPVGKVSRPAAKMFDVELSTGERVQLPLFRISFLGRECRRNISTIEHMESDSLFPETPLRAKRIRLYSVAMIRSAQAAFASLDMGDLSRDDLCATVAAKWDALGLLHAKLIAAVPSEQTTEEGMNGHDSSSQESAAGGQSGD